MPTPLRPPMVRRSLAAALSLGLLLAACSDDDGADVRDLGGDGSASASGSASGSASAPADDASASEPASEDGEEEPATETTETTEAG